MANAKRLFWFILTLIIAQAACDIPLEPTSTPRPEELTRAVMYQQQTLTSAPTVTPSATLTPIFILPSPTPTLPCDAAEFVADITLSDNTALNLGETQNKTWRIKNIGACTWTQNYRAVYDHGDKLSVNDAYPLPHDVSPGGTVDITVPITAPNEYGIYQSFWALQNADGQRIDLQNAGRFFWIKIKAGKMIYDFVENACRAAWASSAAGPLRCPGADNDQRGFVIPFPSIRLHAEDDQNYSYGLFMSADAHDNGWISGTYPSIKIESGYHFLTRVGCLYQPINSNCNIEFQVNYLIIGNLPGDPPHNLRIADQISDGRLEDFDIDLSALAGQTVQIILTVITNGTFSDDSALWIAPRLEKKP